MPKSKEIQVHDATYAHEWFYLIIGARNPWNHKIESLLIVPKDTIDNDLQFRVCPMCNRVEMLNDERGWIHRPPNEDTIRPLFIKAIKEFRRRKITQEESWQKPQFR